MSEQQNREALESYIRAVERQDLDSMFEFLHDDYVEEYPQSGERIRGKQNARSILDNYPGLPTMVDHSYVLSGDLGVLKMTFEYDGKRVYACAVVEFEDGKAMSRRAYFAEPFEAPQWRAQWVERM
ncbi:MAG: nuclear transport factor 2 family protein [Rubrobacteraceae bacterium]